MAGAFLGQSISVELRRENYRACGAFAWVPTADFKAIAQRAHEFLHPEELDLFQGLKIERRQASYLLGRYAAKSALGKCAGLGFEASRTLVATGIFSQPVVHCRAPSPMGVSISHSDRLVCGLAYPEEHPMAVDVEEVDEARTRVMLTQIGREEGELARAVCPSADIAATVLWTAKEALSKALRCGMTCPYELLEVRGLEVRDGGHGGWFRNFGQYRFQSWRRGSAVITIVLPKKTEMACTLPDPL